MSLSADAKIPCVEGWGLGAALLLLLSTIAFPAHAQNYERVAPQAPPAPAAPSTLPPAPPVPNAVPPGTAVIVPSLKGLAFVPGPTPPPSAPSAPGISVDGIDLLKEPGFAAAMQGYLGQPLTFDRLNEITGRVVAFYRARNHPLVDVVVPQQDVSSGVVRIVVTEFRLGAIKAQGNAWFTAGQVEAPFRFQSGDTLDGNTLLAALDAANANPFRHVDLVYQPGSAPGTTNLVLATQDRLPLRVYGSYDNSGQPIVGRDRWSLGFNWGNAFWLDQQLSYQLTTSDDFWHSRDVPAGEPNDPSFVAHSLSWSTPLPWGIGDRLAIFGDYEESVPNIGGSFGETGISGQASLRLTHPLPRTEAFTQAVEGGYDFKTTNNNLDFGGTSISKSATEIDQFPLGYSANLLDPWGSSSLTTTLVLSPGGLTAGNTDAAFAPSPTQTGREGAHAQYAYFHGELDRVTKLPEDAAWAVRLIGQVSSSNLLDTEQISVGGPDLLRGYDPNSINGDEGIVVSNELRTPSFALLPESLRPGGIADQTQLLTFWDYAALHAHQDFVGEQNGIHASSVGLGLRYGFGRFLAVKLDYGWQLQELPGQGHGQFGFVSVTVGY